MILQEYVQFSQWLKSHDAHLRYYAPDEIARLALTCGFDLSIICPNVCERINRIDRLMKFWESPLAEKWLRLVDYESGIEVDEPL